MNALSIKETFRSNLFFFNLMAQKNKEGYLLAH